MNGPDTYCDHADHPKYVFAEDVTDIVCLDQDVVALKLFKEHLYYKAHKFERKHMKRMAWGKSDSRNWHIEENWIQIAKLFYSHSAADAAARDQLDISSVLNIIRMWKGAFSGKVDETKRRNALDVRNGSWGHVPTLQLRETLPS